MDERITDAKMLRVLARLRRWSLLGATAGSVPVSPVIITDGESYFEAWYRQTRENSGDLEPRR